MTPVDTTDGPFEVQSLGRGPRARVEASGENAYSNAGLGGRPQGSYVSCVRLPARIEQRTVQVDGQEGGRETTAPHATRDLRSGDFGWINRYFPLLVRAPLVLHGA